MEKTKLLVADDERVIRDLLRKTLSREGYEVYKASDGLEALNKIKKNNYDMLILDLKMPKINGMELLEKIKKLNKNIIPAK